MLKKLPYGCMLKYQDKRGMLPFLWGTFPVCTHRYRRGGSVSFLSMVMRKNLQDTFKSHETV